MFNIADLKATLEMVERLGKENKKTGEQILLDQVLTASYILIKNGDNSITLESLHQKAGFSAPDIYTAMEEAMAKEMVLNVSPFICKQEWVLKPLAILHVGKLLEKVKV